MRDAGCAIARGAAGAAAVGALCEEANQEIGVPKDGSGDQPQPRAWIWSMRFLYMLVMAYARMMVRTMTATVIRAFVASV